MERQPYGTDRVSETRRIPYRTTKKLGRSYKVNGSDTRNNEEAVRQKQRNPQELKEGDNMWLENKNIHLNRPSKKLDQKRYRFFRISKDIGQRVF